MPCLRIWLRLDEDDNDGWRMMVMMKMMIWMVVMLRGFYSDEAEADRCLIVNICIQRIINCRAGE